MILSFLSSPEIQQLERRIGHRLRKRGVALRKRRGLASEQARFTGYKIIMANSELCLGCDDYSLGLYEVAHLALAI